jgi:hypothetical protein
MLRVCRTSPIAAPKHFFPFENRAGHLAGNSLQDCLLRTQIPNCRDMFGDRVLKDQIRVEGG